MDPSLRLYNSNIQSYCRTCLENLNGTHHDIFATPDLQIKFSACTSLLVEPGDQLSTKLCEPCHTKINDFYAFKQMCISAMTRYQEYINSDNKPLPLELDIDHNSQTRFIILNEYEKDDHNQNAKFDDAIFNVKCEYESEKEEVLNKDQAISKHFDECNDLSNNASNLNIYEDLAHKNVTVKRKKTKSCKICKKGFRKTETLECHMRIHKGLKPYACSYCEKTFNKSDKKKYHEMLHTNKYPYKCDVCNKKFCQPYSLKMHKMKIHQKRSKELISSSKILCEEFNVRQNQLKDFSTEHEGSPMESKLTKTRKLRVRIIRHAGIRNYFSKHYEANKLKQNRLEKNESNCDVEKTRYQCKLCYKVYCNKSILYRHERIFHNGIKKFPCSYCEKTFGRNQVRKYHELTHTGERPYECIMCEQKFTQPCVLERHRKVHLRLSFPCNICGKSYIRQKQLIYHIKEHEGSLNEKFSSTDPWLWQNFTTQGYTLDENQ